MLDLDLDLLEDGDFFGGPFLYFMGGFISVLLLC